MHYVAIVDCGTTNSRVYIADDTGRVIAKASRRVGVRDTAQTGNAERLSVGLRDAFNDALTAAKLCSADLVLIASSGMITSELGLCEIPHLWAPVSAQQLAAGIVEVGGLAAFPKDVPVFFVPGVKNWYDPEVTDAQGADMLDFMRGEETQAVGMAEVHQVPLPTLFTVLSSHTKFVSLDTQGRIRGSLTTLSGQLYEAVASVTSIAKSFAAAELPEVEFQVEDYLEVIGCAHRFCEEGGLLRTLLITRFLDTLLDTSLGERRVFVEAAIASEDIRVLNRMSSLDLPDNESFVLVGNPRRVRLYEYMLGEVAGVRKKIVSITEPQQIDLLSINGTIKLLRLAGHL